MKKIIIFIALMLMLSALAFGQKKMSVEQTLMKMEEEMAADLQIGKTTSFEKYFADSAVLTDPYGMFLTKTELIALFKSGDLKFESSKIDDMKVSLYGASAIVTYRTTDKGTYKGQDLGGQNRWTNTFAKLNGKWLLIAGQGTPIAK
ncbi:MAG: nuclear transport factor 2 family protein [Pyrinomonadaceae bacterium]